MAQTAANPSDAVLSASKFIVSIDGVDLATFSDLSGINSEVEPAEYMAVGKNGTFTHSKLFGKTKPPTVTLKRGLDTNNAMWAWHQLALAGAPTARKTCQLQMCAADGKPTSPPQTYILENAWVQKLEIAGMSAGKSEVVMETVTLTCDYIIGPGS